MVKVLREEGREGSVLTLSFLCSLPCLKKFL
jgi:hypothetical protein